MSATVPPVRVFLVDDHPVILAGVRALVGADAGVEVIGEAREGRTALRLAAELKPDVLVLDLSLPGLNGVEVARQLRTDCPNCKVLALTVHEDGAYLRQVLEAGGVGYVLKRSATDELIRAIHAVAAGGFYLDPAIAGRLVGYGQQKPQEPALPRAAELSERELDVLRLTSLGHSNKTIAGNLRIGVKSVETYKARAMAKLGFRTRVEVVRYALSKGWLAEA